MLNEYEPNDILIACALRFDGYKYVQDTGLQPKLVAEEFFRTGRWDLSDADKLANFFLLQRALGKWDLVYEPPNGRWWRAFRTLFFEVVNLPIPERYRMPRYYDEWQEHYQPHIAECIERVRREHDLTEYTS